MNGMVIGNIHVFGGDITMLPQLSNDQSVCQVIMLDLLADTVRKCFGLLYVDFNPFMP